jgi:hypothetical protein
MNITEQRVYATADELYDIYDREEDEALTRRRDAADMSEDDTEDEGEKNPRHSLSVRI